MTLRFQIQPTQNAQWSWWLYAANNEMVAWAGRDIRLLHPRAARRHRLQDGITHGAIRGLPRPRRQVALASMALERQRRCLG